MLARTPAGLGFTKMIYVFSKRNKCFTPPPASRFSGCFIAFTLGSWYFNTASCPCMAWPLCLLGMLDISQGPSTTSPAWVEVEPMSYFCLLSLPITHTGAQYPFADSPTRYIWGEKRGGILARPLIKICCHTTCWNPGCRISTLFHLCCYVTVSQVSML